MKQPVLVVLDDDPTGTQTVHDVPVLTEWTVESLAREFAADSTCFYILTNSRALGPAQAASLNREISHNLKAAAGNNAFIICSRSDSTLRGHFPLETDVLNEELGPHDATFLIPFFDAGGRLTIDDVHYVREGEKLIPAAETPFAKDPAFGYASSNLKDYVEEKTRGRIPASAVLSISAKLDRQCLTSLLLNLSGNVHVVVNAAQREELDLLTRTIRQATLQGKRFLVRTAAEFIASWIGQPPAPLLDRKSLGTGSGAGLIIAGSYVPKTTRQLEELRRIHSIETVVLDAGQLLAAGRQALIESAVGKVDQIVNSNRDVLVMTSRSPVGHAGATESLESGRRISDALVGIVSALSCRPGWIIAKGGITSSDIATKALGIRRSLVAGQLLPGIPVWRTGPETAFPGIPYVVFPGNVGNDQALADAYATLVETI